MIAFLVAFLTPLVGLMLVILGLGWLCAVAQPLFERLTRHDS